MALFLLYLWLICHFASAEIGYMYFIRHVDSTWNEAKRKGWTGKGREFLTKDAPVSTTGTDQLQVLLDDFGNEVYAKFKEDLSIASCEIHTSTLRRAQFTALTALKSLINRAKVDSDDTAKTKLNEAPFMIFEWLRESTSGVDAKSEFTGGGVVSDSETGEVKIDCTKWRTYLHEGIVKSVERTAFLKKLHPMRFCENARYMPPGEGEKFGEYAKYLSAKISSGTRISRYGTKTFIVGGHSHWFMDFATKFGATKYVKEWGKSEKKIQNARMVRVTLETDDDTVTIINIETYTHSPEITRAKREVGVRREPMPVESMSPMSSAATAGKKKKGTAGRVVEHEFDAMKIDKDEMYEYYDQYYDTLRDIYDEQLVEQDVEESWIDGYYAGYYHAMNAMNAMKKNKGITRARYRYQYL